MFSCGSPGRGSGQGLLTLVAAQCSCHIFTLQIERDALEVFSLQVALVQIIQEFEGTTYT